MLSFLVLLVGALAQSVPCNTDAHWYKLGIAMTDPSGNSEAVDYWFYVGTNAPDMPDGIGETDEEPSPFPLSIISTAKVCPALLFIVFSSTYRSPSRLSS